MTSACCRALIGLCLLALWSLPTKTAYAKTYNFCACTGGTPVPNSHGSTCAAGYSCNVHPEIVLTFWQDTNAQVWTNPQATSPAQSPTYSQFIGSALSLVNSPYFAQLQQYGPIDRPRLSPFAPIYTGTPPGAPTHTTKNFNTSDVIAIINSQVASGLLPAPVANDNTIYVVVVPANSFVSACGPGSNASGCNFPGGLTVAPQTYYSAAYVFADGGIEFPHEVTEAIAGFEGANLTSTSCPNNPSSTQIADVCQCSGDSEFQNYANVQGYWSAKDGKCVIPETWGNLSYNSTALSNGWTNTTALPRQAYGGGGKVAFTDSSDRAWYFDSSSGAIAQYDGTTEHSESAAGAASEGGGRAIIAGAAVDTKDTIDYYDTGSKQDFAIGVPNGPVTSLTVTGQGVIVATDTAAQPWYYMTSDPGKGWTQFGGPGDQFVAVYDNVYALTPARNAIYSWSSRNFGGGGSWVLVDSGQSYMQIVGNSDSEYFSTSEPGGVFFWPGGRDVGPLIVTDDFAVTGLAQATYLASGITVWGQANSLSNWYQFGSYPVGRVISGNIIYATSCPGSYPCVIE